MLHEQLQHLADWYKASLETGGYPLIVLLMAIESSVVPLPSEVVIPPAAYFASKTGNMSLIGIVLSGAFGSWIGATAMYWTSRLAGRPLVLAYGRFVLIGADKVEGAERWAARFGSVGIFISRLLPVVRHLIGIPAGIVRMDYFKFSAFTLVGSATWCSVLCWLGVTMGDDPKILQGDARRWGVWIAGIAIAIAVMYYFLVHRYMKSVPAPPAPAPPAKKKRRH